MIIVVWLEVDDSAAEKSADFSSATSTNVDPESGVVTSKEAGEEAEVEEQLVAAVVAHAQSSVQAVEESGNFSFKNVLCYALVTILCFADASGGAGGVIGARAGAGAREGEARGQNRGGDRVGGRGRGRGRGRGAAAPAASAPPPNRTRTREVRPAQRLDK